MQSATTTNLFECEQHSLIAQMTELAAHKIYNVQVNLIIQNKMV